MAATNSWQSVGFWKSCSAYLRSLWQYALLRHPTGRQYCIHRVLRPAIHLSQNTRKWARNAKNKKYIAGYFATFCVLHPFFRISCQGRHSCANSKDFVVYFFAALIKHEIRLKYEKCIESVSYFVVCFAKNTNEMRKVYSLANKAMNCFTSF